MDRRVRNIGFYVILILLFVIMLYGLRETLNSRDSLTWKRFTEMLEADQVASVKVTPNKEVPTGTLEISMMDGSVE